MRSISVVALFTLLGAATVGAQTSTHGTGPLNEWVSIQPDGPDNGVGGTPRFSYVGNGGTAIVSTSFSRILRRTSQEQPWEAYEVIVDGEPAASAGRFDSVPNQPGVVLSLASLPDGNNCLIRSTNDGDTWTGIYCSTESFPIRFAVSPSESLIYYLAVAEIGLLKSVDGGSNWALVNASVPTPLTFYVDAGDPDTLYGLDNGTIVASRDGGATFARSDNGVPPATFDMNSMVVDPSTAGRLFTGSSSGVSAVYRSTDAAASWQRFELPPDIRLRGQINDLALDPLNPATVYAAVGSNSAADLVRSDDDGANWLTVPSPSGLRFGRFVKFASDGSSLLGGENGLGILDADTVMPSQAGFNDYASRYLRVSASDPTRFVATNGKGSIITTDPELPLWAPRYIPEGRFTNAFDIDVNDPSTIQAVFGNQLVVTDDGGDTWDEVFPPLNSPSIRFATFSPLDSDLKYVINSEEVLVSTDGGATWVNGIFPPEYEATSRGAIIASPIDQNIALLGTARDGVYVTRDMGTSWTPVEIPGTDIVVEDIAFDPKVATDFYVATDNAVWKSEDLGESFIPMLDEDEGLINITALVVDPVVPERLFVHTFQRIHVRDPRDGTWTTPLSRAPTLGGSITFGELLVGHPQRSGALYQVLGSLWEVQLDIDRDGVGDDIDNCILTANPQQIDADNDGIGNLCDADIAPAVNDCVVNVLDLAALRLAFFSSPGDTNWNAAADFTGDGVVNAQDLGVLRLRFFQPLGYSGADMTCNDG